MISPSERTIVIAALKASTEKTNNFHHEARAFRNRLVIMTAIALLGGCLLILLQWRIPTAAIIAKPKDAKAISSWQVLVLVMVFGAIGSLLTTIPACSKIPRVSSPFNFPLQQAFLKIAVGSLTAIIGIIVAGGAAVSTGFQSLSAVIGVAIAFGAAQQTVTGFLDKRATTIIDSLAGK